MHVSQLAGVGDMKKSVYDPNEDGKIAMAQLVDAASSEAEAGTIADGKITTHTGKSTGVHGVGASTVCSETEADAKIDAKIDAYPPSMTDEWKKYIMVYGM